VRIGLVTEYFPPFVVGGAELSTFQLAKALAREGHVVSVLTPNYGEVPEEIREEIRIHRFWFPQRLKAGELARSRYLENPFYPFYLMVRILFWAKRLGLEVLHAQNAHSFVGTFWAARLLNVRVVVSVRDFTVSDPFPVPEATARSWGSGRRLLVTWAHRLNSRWRRAALFQADAAIFVSHFLKRHYLGKRLRFKGEVCVIYNLPPESHLSPVQTEATRSQWGLPREAKIILFGGRRSPGKGMQNLLETIPKVTQRYPKAHFVLAGRETDNGFSEAFSRLKGVSLLGQLPNSAFLDLMRASDLVISPAIWQEPLSRLLLEAMSYRKPIVATDTGGTPELILQGENGFLVPSGNAEIFTEKVVKLLEDETLSQEMGERGQALLCERFSPKQLIAAWEQVYTTPEGTLRR